MAHRYLGPKLVTFADATVDHILVPRSTSDTQSILSHAAGEAWLFSLADFHIVSHESGFGRMGAMIACNWDNIVQLDNWELDTKRHNLTYWLEPEEEAQHTRANTHHNNTAGILLLDDMEKDAMHVNIDNATGESASWRSFAARGLQRVVPAAGSSVLLAGRRRHRHRPVHRQVYQGDLLTST
jgi:hypothetical protein